MEEFEFSLIVSVLLVGFVAIAGLNASAGVTPLFALALLALSQAGYFFLEQLRKAGLSSPKAEAAVVAAAFGCMLLAFIARGQAGAILPLTFIPIAFCTPAAACAARSHLF